MRKTREIPLRVSILPGRPWRDLHLRNAEVSDARIEHGTEDAVTIANEARGDDVRANRFDDLLCGPRRVRLRRHVDVKHAPTLERERTKKTYTMPNVTVGTVGKSIAIVPPR